MSDHEHTDDTDKQIEETNELDLSDMTEQSGTDFQTLLDEAVLDSDTGAGPEEEAPESLSEPDLDALVSESDEPESLDFMLHDNDTGDTAADQDESSSEMPEMIAETDEMSEPPVAEDASVESAPEEIFDATSSEWEDDDSPAEEDEGDSDPFSEDESAVEPLSGDETALEPISAADEASESDDEQEYVAPSAGHDGDGPEGPEEKSGSKLPLLLVLLTIGVVVGLIVGAGAAFFTDDTPDREPAPTMPMAQKAVPVPEQPKAQAMQETQPAEPAAPESQMDAESGPQEAQPVDQGDTRLAVITPQTPENGAAAKPEPQTPPQEAMQEAAKKPADAPKAAMTQGAYTLQGGVFVFRSHLEKMQARVKKLGFDTQVVDEEKLLPMSRLRVGEFPAKAASDKLQQVKKLVPHSTFTMKKGDQVIIYAGSYYYAGAARRAAKHLADKGLPVQVEVAKVMMPVHVLRFGAFADHAAAEAKLAEVKAAGVSAFVKKTGSEAAH